MNILVINCGSSSVKSEVINTMTGGRLLEMDVQRINSKPEIDFKDGKKIKFDKTGHQAVLDYAFPLLVDKLSDINIHAVGHRVVHGGKFFDEPVIINEEVEQKIEALSSLAPLHNPVNLKGVQIAKEYFTDIPHMAVFDTAFHATLPRRAKTYAIPKKLAEKYDIQRYGFHGTSHDFVAKEASRFLDRDIKEQRIITCHLGNGCSVAAIEYGRSVETSMGMTPLEGLVMGSRSGDIDPGILIHLLKSEKLKPEELDHLLNEESGLQGISGISNDMRDVIQRAAEGDDDCRLAIQVFAHSLRKYIGAYAAIMGGVDAIIFTGGIGENSPMIRHRVCQRLDFLGAIINEDKNHDVRLSKTDPIADFSWNHSPVKLLVVQTDEQLSIARQTVKLLQKDLAVNSVPAIPVAISARHIHLSKVTLEKLFGEGYELTVKKPLSQPGQFAANETVKVIGSKNSFDTVRILGPLRSKDQLEISRTDEFFLGIDAPIRESGKTENTPGCILEGPKGRVQIHDGVICAWRHIHMTPADALSFGVKDRDVVDVNIGSDERSLTFGNVLIRVSPKYKLEMHIDTDEGNAAEIGKGATGVLLSTDGQARLTKKKLK
jgi:acetate kinase